MKRRRTGSFGYGSRLVVCPSCNCSVHTLLINSHLEACVQRDPPRPPPAPAAPAAAAASQEDADAMVPCPICSRMLRNADVFAHIEDDCSPPAEQEPGSSSDSPPPLVSVEEDSPPPPDKPTSAPPATAPPAESDLGSSSDSPGSSSDSPPPLEEDGSPPPPDKPTSAPPAIVAPEVPDARIDRLAQELRCSLCFETFDDPHSLPCQHTFCRACIMGYFRQQARQQQACPLCKAPTWRRQVAQNHTLAGIVRAFNEVAGQSGEEPPPSAVVAQPPPPTEPDDTTPASPRPASPEEVEVEVASPVY